MMAEQTKSTEIGVHTITVSDVRRRQDIHEEGGIWLTADVEITVTTEGVYGESRHLVPCGCWLDTDSDHQLWSAAHEGDRAIGQAIVGIGSGPSDGPLLGLLPDACWSLGQQITQAIREDYQSEQE